MFQPGAYYISTTGTRYDTSSYVSLTYNYLRLVVLHQPAAEKLPIYSVATMMSTFDKRKATHVTSRAFKQPHGTTINTQEDMVFNFLKGFTSYNKENAAATRQFL
jgi:hypothetical protein